MKNLLFIFLLFSGGIFLSITSHASVLDNAEKQLIIVNKHSNQLAFFDDGELVRTFSVATGRTANLTPEGTFSVLHLIRDMPYYPHNIPGGASNNPLGPRWIGLSVPGTSGFTYGIHGNAADWSIGTYASSGCVRMHNDEVTWLYDQVYIGTKVIILNSPLSFEDIAKNEGYSLNQESDVNFSIDLINGGTVYSQPNTHTDSYNIAPQTLHITKTRGDWFGFEIDNETKWIQTHAYSTEQIKQQLVDLLIQKEVNVYPYPNDRTPSIGGLSPGIVTSFERTNGWYHIQTPDRGDVWMKASFVTPFEWNVKNTSLAFNSRSSQKPMDFWNKTIQFFQHLL